MKENKLKIFLIPLITILLMLLPVSVSADTKSSDGDWYYNKLSEDTVEITGYIGGLYTLKVPETIDEFTVVKIGDNAFSRSSKISAIVLPTTITEIGNEAFSNCYNLRAVSIPKSVLVVGNDAFLNTPYLSTLYSSAIDGVTYINTIAIHYDNSKTDVTLKHGTTSFGSIFKDSTNLVSLTIPSTVSEIEDFAFLGCTSLRYVIIPDSVFEIGSAAFLGINPKLLTICSNSASAARVFAMEYGYRYDSIPSSSYLFDTYVQYDKHSSENLTFKFYPGDGIKKMTAITSATLQSSTNYNSNVYLSLEAGVVLSGNYNNNLIVIPNSAFSDVEKGLYIVTMETNTGDKLVSTLNITDNMPVGDKPSVSSQSKVFDIYKPNNISFSFNLGKYASKATTITDVEINNVKVNESNYTINNSEITFKEDYLLKLKEGQYKISVKFDNKDKTEVLDRLTLTVKDTEPKDVKPTNIVLSKTLKYTSAGGYYTLTAKLSPRDVTEDEITWTSSNESIATVSKYSASKGRVYAHKAGVVVITATDSEGHQDRCFFIVKPEPKMSKNTVSLSKGKTTTLKFVDKYSWADVTVKTSNSKVATADTKGKITAKGKGTATITWTIDQCGKKYTAKTKVTVK